MRRNHARGAFGRLSALVLAGVVTSAVVAAIAFAAAGNGQGGPVSSAGQVKLGSDPAFPMLAYSWGASNSGSASGGGAGTGKANVQDISITKLTDATSVGLLTKVTTGAHIPTVIITAALGGGATMEYELDDVLVTSVSLGGAGGKGADTENITFNFARVTWTHTDDTGNETSGNFDLTSHSG